MGLIYLFPTDQNDPDHVQLNEKEVLPRSYGLPYIFWFYAGAILSLLFLLFISIKDPLNKYLQVGSEIDMIIGYSLWALFFLIPLMVFAFFFYEKNLKVTSGLVTIVHKVFSIVILKKEIQASKDAELKIQHFIDSPNMARIKDEKALKGFQNKGYFELVLTDKNSQKNYLIDRSSRKADLIKIKDLLSSKLV